LRGDEALGQLALGHLQREQRDRLAVLQGGVLGEVGHQRALSHRRAGGEDDQVPRLKAARDGVEVVEARGRARDRLALARELVELVQLGVEQLVDGPEVLARVVVGDFEDAALREVDQLARRRLVGVHALLDLVGRRQEPAQHRVLAHDAGVLAQMADGGDRTREHVDHRAAADRLEVAGLLEVLGQREGVDRLALRVQVEHGLVDAPVGLPVEVLRLQALVDDERRHHGVGQEDGAQHRLLCLEVVRRRQGSARGGAVAVDGRTVGDGHGTRASLGSKLRRDTHGNSQIRPDGRDWPQLGQVGGYERTEHGKHAGWVARRTSPAVMIGSWPGRPAV
jgi:hypothetical protein